MDKKTLTRSDLELMAPAGSREALMAAINAGADAVYFGVGELNMRSGASSAFGLENLPEVADICRQHGVKSYLTLNTVIFDDDFEEAAKTVRAAKEAGIDAVIASDVAVMRMCNELGVDVHLSTQLNIANVSALQFYAQFADVAVLARELNLKQVAHIARAIEEKRIMGPTGRPMRLEMFCHGALCMAVSGKCYMSLHTRGKSANRGVCLQTCRRNYVIKDTQRDIELELDHGHILSPKDLKTIDFVEDMVAAGVRVFKIEGRARSPEYVNTVVACYDEALKAACEGGATEAQKADWNTRLAEVFNRGFWDGYYLGRSTAELTEGNGSLATLVKRYVGKCVKYFPKAGVAQFQMHTSEFGKGERLLITGPTTGVIELTADEIFVGGQPADVARKGDDLTLRVPARVRENDKLYVLSDRPLAD